MDRKHLPCGEMTIREIIASQVLAGFAHYPKGMEPDWAAELAAEWTDALIAKLSPPQLPLPLPRKEAVKC
jgi:hypothetical protein